MSDPNPLEQQFNKIWQKVPEEERREVLIRAHGKAFETCALVVIFGCTAAFGLAMPWILLGVAALIPVLFQVIVTRIWVETKPQTVARYFMANRTASQYATSLGVANPHPKTIFRGSLLPLQESNFKTDPEFAAEYAEELAQAQTQKEVWIALFADSLLMFSENPGGARLEFGNSILHNFSVTLDNPEDLAGNSMPPQLIIETGTGSEAPTGWLVASPHPSALVACERKIRFLTQKAQAAALEESLPGPRGVSHSLFASNQLGATL